MVLLSFVLIYALCATVLLLAIAQDRHRQTGAQRRDPAGPPARRQPAGGQRDLVFTTQH